MSIITQKNFRTSARVTYVSLTLLLTGRACPSRHIIPATMQIIFAIRRGGTKKRLPPPSLNPDVLSLHTRTAQPGRRSPYIGLTTTILAINHLSRTPCRFPDSRHRQSCRATLETVLECRPIGSRPLTGKALAVVVELATTHKGNPCQA